MTNKIFFHRMKKIVSFRWIILSILLFALIGYHFNTPLKMQEKVDIECPGVLVSDDAGGLYYEDSGCKLTKFNTVNAIGNFIVWSTAGLILDHFVFRLVLRRNNPFI